MNTTLRPATLADAARAAEVLIGTRLAFMLYAPSAHTDDEVHEWVARCLIPSGGVTVAERQGAVVATMATEQAAGCSWITQMEVDPGLVGQGIGSLLQDHAIRTLFRPIRLWTFQSNSGARRFHERHGFQAIESTDGQGNEERCPDVLYELAANQAGASSEL